jgi:DNA-binding protein YbaB
VVIDPTLLEDADAEMLQDLVLSAVNLALISHASWLRSDWVR